MGCSTCKQFTDNNALEFGKEEEQKVIGISLNSKLPGSKRSMVKSNSVSINGPQTHNNPVHIQVNQSDLQ